MIEITKYSELDFGIKDTLNQIIHDEFGHIPIVNETDWADPDLTIIKYQDNEIAAFYNIVERLVNVDGRAMKIAGINNVITPKTYRGKGHASDMLKNTEYLIFDQLKSELGILLCADALIPFYERLGWYSVACPVYFDQAEGERLWKANTMLLSHGKRPSPKIIKLNGLPW